MEGSDYWMVQIHYYLLYGLTSGNGSSSPTGGIKEENGGDGESGGVKANKGMILRKSVDYIRYDFFISIFLLQLANPYYFPRCLQQLVTAQGSRNRELEQELKTYRRPSGSGGSPKLNGYPQRRSSAIGRSGTRTASHSRSTPSDGGKEEDSMMLHDGVDGIGVEGGGVIEFGNYGGGGDGRGGLPSMPEGDDEDVDYGDSPQHHSRHHHRIITSIHNITNTSINKIWWSIIWVWA